MEMYSIQWGLMVLYVVAGPLLAFFLGAVAVPVVICSIFSRKYRRGLIASRIALGLTIASVLLSLEMWYELITGRLIDGHPVNYSDPDFWLYEFIGGLEAVVLAASILSLVRRRLRPA
ncbi:MAG TPA: hypothetical protein VFA12_11340 [Stellaceae bacterium]|nr:hypothetical protein [Stellaceae bacterium]